ncbi:hypothetical protein AOCH_002822 [Aspergillus ochraceoroseus]|uniref:Uncharacterized protein n=2 Tax=Aspergillus ochraceoroseus TaxID=138278 RepID=A0A0F8WLZ2_9EURO|nr:hypothetical protein AOCH_002822 [Aspergillus ochraceoroseus]
MSEIAFTWDTYSSLSQTERSAFAHEQGKLSAAPSSSHLSRALYIPRHDGATSQLTICDVSDRYANATGDLPMTSSQYAVDLGMMKKPTGDGADGVSVVYEVGVHGSGLKDGEEEEMLVSVSDLGRPSGVKVEVAITDTEDKDGSITMKMKTPNPIKVQDEKRIAIPIVISYPIAPSQTRKGEFKHPYFTFTQGESFLQWQIHPAQHGRLRYTLVKIPSQGPLGQAADDAATNPDTLETLAIYQHIGVGAPSLSLSYSEGILLLPLGEDTGRETEALVVGSALGMLWQLRELHGGGKRKKDGGKKFGSLKSFLGRKV